MSAAESAKAATNEDIWWAGVLFWFIVVALGALSFGIYEWPWVAVIIGGIVGVPATLWATGWILTHPTWTGKQRYFS